MRDCEGGIILFATYQTYTESNVMFSENENFTVKIGNYFQVFVGIAFWEQTVTPLPSCGLSDLEGNNIIKFGYTVCF